MLTLLIRPADLEEAYGGIDNQRSMDECSPLDATEVIRRAAYGFNYRGERVTYGPALLDRWGEIEAHVGTDALNVYYGCDQTLVALRMLAEQGGIKPYYAAMGDLALPRTLDTLAAMRQSKQTVLEYLEAEDAALHSGGTPGLAWFA